MAEGLFVVLSVAWLVWGPFGIGCYVGGLFNWTPVFVFLFLAMAAGLTLAAAFPVLIVRAAVTWRRRTRSGRRRILFWLVLTGGFVCPYAWGIAGLSTPPFDMFVRGFSRYAERRVDVQAIQNWLETLDYGRGTGEDGGMGRQLAESEQPACIAELAPRVAIVEPDDAGRSTIRFFWGSGFIGSWGVTVGPENMPTPSSALVMRSRRPCYPLAPGAYIWSSD